MLRSLTIKNFRSLEDLRVEKLGRVNLIVGMNNSGKSSVLEAIRIYAGSGHRGLLEEIARGHDERYRPTDSEASEPELALPFEEFFSGRQFPTDEEIKIVIGDDTDPANLMTMEHVFLREVQETVTDETEASRIVIRRRPVSKDALSTITDEIIRQAIVVTKGDRNSTIVLDSPRRPSSYVESIDTTRCSVVPTRFVSMDELARDWDNVVVFKEYDGIVTQALQYITDEFESLVFVENSDAPYVRRDIARRDGYRVPKVKLAGLSRAVPLNSLGDGMLRVLQLVLKVFPAKNGFLLIDEFENGLHYSVQGAIWDLMFNLATRLNIQIFATTHSWDCISSFASIAKKRSDIDGVLFRVGRSVLTSTRGKTIATVFDEDQLYGLTQADLEVR